MLTICPIQTEKHCGGFSVRHLFGKPEFSSFLPGKSRTCTTTLSVRAQPLKVMAIVVQNLAIENLKNIMYINGEDICI